MNLLNTVGREHAYCDQCREPAEVVAIEIHGWRHRFKLCSTCLDSIGRDVAKPRGEHEQPTTNAARRV